MRYYLEHELKTVEAATPAELVTRLKEVDPSSTGETDAEYMQALAGRFWEFYGDEPPRFDTVENFVNDLLAENWLRQIAD